VSRSDTAALLPLAESIADGAQVDWDAVEAHASRDEQAVIRQLRILSSLAVLHRSLPAETQDDRSSSNAPRNGAAPAIGKWAHLALIERLGGGTFGDVYRAWDGELEREVALKLLRADEEIDDLRASRIATEGRLLARVHHHNVVTVYGVAAHEKRVGLWMELVRGVTLEQQLGRHGTFSAREAALVGVDLCGALAAIHAAGLIHRDVKAQNVMREAGGRIVLMDLGTGREADVGGVRRAVPDFAGTPLYLAPEIFTGAAASERTDLYSLGVLLYHLVTGSFPVRATTIDGLQAGHRQGGTRLRDARADLPAAFVKVVDRAIASDPSKRYESAGALEADLADALDDTTPTAAAAAAPVPAPILPWLTWPRSGILAAVAVIVAIAVVGWPALRGRTTTPVAIAPGTIHSIAVLPLVNLSGDPAQEYFADGMTDELIGKLGQIGDLNVISRTSAMQFKGSTKPLPEIARALNVDAVLEGSVRFVDGGAPGNGARRRVRVNARLIYAGTDTQLWDRAFESAASDPMALQDDLVRAITAGIDRRLAPSHSGGQAVTEQDADAFELYLKGRFAGNTRTRESLTRSIAFFKEALERDPRYAKAYAGLADAYRNLGTYGAMPYAEAIAHASQAAEQALAIDPTLGEAHASLGLVHDGRLEWSAADASFKHAIDLNPGYVSAHQWYAIHLSKRGLLEEASVEIEKAAVLDPLSTGVQTEMALIMFLSRRYDAAIAEAEKTLQLNPDLVRPRVLIAEALAQRGQFDRALEALDAAARLDPANSEMQIYRGCVLALAGRRDEALKLAGDLGERYRVQQEGHASDVAAIYASLRDANRAFEWLERGHQARDPWLPYIAVDPWFDNIRKDPRFDTLLASLPLTQ
jgi:TolB-like protein/tetratricopeptide (TPR) repeat protein